MYSLTDTDRANIYVYSLSTSQGVMISKNGNSAHLHAAGRRNLY
jgi:hypothetical protein